MTERRSLEDRLQDSAVARAKVIRDFGFVPDSILHLSRGRLHRSLYHLANERARKETARSITAIEGMSDEVRLDALKRRSAGIDAPHKGGPEREAISVMSAELVDFVIRYYAPLDGDEKPTGVYLDPFVGQGVQAQVSALRGVSYYGVDLSEEYVSFTDAALQRYELRRGQVVEVRRQDAKVPPDFIPDGVGDFSFTSPPYWDIEFYSDDPEQLGTGKTYEEFLSGLQEVYRVWRPKFRPGAAVVVNVNDFRRGGRFVPFHSDLVPVLAEVGYRPDDVWIVEGLLGMSSRIFAVSRIRTHAPRVHEYLLVFRVDG